MISHLHWDRLYPIESKALGQILEPSKCQLFSPAFLSLFIHKKRSTKLPDQIATCWFRVFELSAHAFQLPGFCGRQIAGEDKHELWGREPVTSVPFICIGWAADGNFTSTITTVLMFLKLDVWLLLLTTKNNLWKERCSC